MKPILETIDLVKYYGSGTNVVKAIDHTDLAIRRGEFTAIVGGVAPERALCSHAGRAGPAGQREGPHRGKGHI